MIMPGSGAVAIETVTNFPIIEVGAPPVVPVPGDEDEEIESAPEDTEIFQDSEMNEGSGKGHGNGKSLWLDGKFRDWWGMPNLGDRQHDSSENTDLKAVYYGTNDGDSNLYFMIQRYSPSNEISSAIYKIYFDTNDNEVYSDSVDKYAIVSYVPISNNRGMVIVGLYRSGGMLINIYTGFWGEGTRFSERCEFKISMDNLGIIPHQPIRFYVTSFGNPQDRLPDSGDIQWAPVPSSGKLGLALLFFLGTIIIIRSVKKREKC
ncbi:MAG: hypothetical protein JL50_15140 [Peptococcaceae bacterium BICA1-7]|nr:MAG: hypothetical protein JL50_15140 [Peptococcaceae bacterium BICA1-7]HBV96879.1 hypothetical protein [Desulfotomaculum sp.]